jgi:anaerobic ribonucleoside-triphosphate reductase activating protein
MEQLLRVGHRLDRSEIYGPGIRSVIWLQGCTLTCKGCWNTQYWPSQGGEEILVSQLLSELDLLDDIEGITILGGEPLQQAPATLALIEGCKQRDLTVFLYTGYELEEFDVTMQACFDASDIVITGRYEQDKRDTTLRWRGSLNQQVHLISSRYNQLVLGGRTEVECHILSNGNLTVVGYAESEFIDNLEVFS